MEAKKFDCVEMMHQGAEEVQKQTRGKSKEQEIAFWATRCRTARLFAGDWLYIPSRWWHMAKCIEDSLSISLGLSVAR
jgi:ribosomal protein L16 Arg81 hydroxylase